MAITPAVPLIADFFEHLGSEVLTGVILAAVLGVWAFLKREAIMPRLRGSRFWFQRQRRARRVYLALEDSLGYMAHLRDVMQSFWRAQKEPPASVRERVRRDILEPIRSWMPTVRGEIVRVVWFRPTPDGDELLMYAQVGHTEEGEAAMRLHVGDGIAGRVFASRETINVPDIARDDRFEQKEDGARSGSLLCVPIARGRKVTGVLSILRTQKNGFGLGEERYVEALGAAIGAVETLEERGSTQEGGGT